MGYWILKIRCININYMCNLKKKKDIDVLIRKGEMETQL